MISRNNRVLAGVSVSRQELPGRSGSNFQILQTWMSHTGAMSEKPGADTPPSVADLLDGDRLLTIEDVAKRLNVVKKTVQNWISNGTLPAVKLGRDRYVLRSKLQGILERKMREA